MRSLYDKSNRQLEGDIFTQSGLSFLLEAYVASTFATKRQAEMVRLCNGDRPDFEVRFEDGREKSFEVTEALNPARRRGDEYRSEPGEISCTFTEGVRVKEVKQCEIEENINAIPQSLKNIVKKKIEKRYDEGVGLVIYLNIPTYGYNTEQIKRNIPSSISPAAECFSEVWVLWGTELMGPFKS